jgi:6-pyruvoyl-tetrahydropterin synthase
MHGHTWKVRVELEGEVNAATGILVDFGEVGKAISAVIDPWDHKFMAPQNAEVFDYAGTLVKDGRYYVIDNEYVLPEKDVVVLPVSIVSSENLAQLILGKLCVNSWVVGKTVRVQVCESGDNVAEASSVTPQYQLNSPAFSTNVWPVPEYHWNWWVYPANPVPPVRWEFQITQ